MMLPYRNSDSAAGSRKGLIPPDPPESPNPMEKSLRGGQQETQHSEWQNIQQDEPQQQWQNEPQGHWQSARQNETQPERQETRRESGLLSDQSIAGDLLLSAKMSVRTYADAVSEATTPAVRSLLKQQLNQAIAFQDQMNAYMSKQGWYNAYNMNQQILLDLNESENVLNQIED